MHIGIDLDNTVIDYDRVFGPSHPGSSTVAPEESAVEWVWFGAVTSDTFTVSAKLDDDATSARLFAGQTAEFVEATISDAVRPALLHWWMAVAVGEGDVVKAPRSCRSLPVTSFAG